ncbi:MULTISPECIES: ATP-binding cassette domain-containing protein [Gemella]|uniref:ATP-binding cassette domain-containing protein n=1 Tax=Gemella TaxID=1378 RepID=UPI000768306A|nr:MULTISPECIES: ABC transporter ATP-binding protein [Gemella]AME09831.1 nitrate ABC transporter ATP-binding protein [Gemella sp. oral taxon 928]AXI25970.1 ABC transporter ATP-binding protein [Gemella sp. ND 6198]
MTVLSIKNLTYSYPNNDILKNINIHVNSGEIVSILGGSGVGKTTLFNLIAGIIELSQGEIAIENNTNFKGKVSYMLQKDLLLEHKTVIGNIILPLLIKKIKKKEAEKEAIENLKLFNLYEYKDKYPSELSGGMRQRVALLRTYMFKQKLFLLDEPFSALDAITKISLHSWFLDISRTLNLTTLLITHDIDEAIELSNRIYIIKNKPGEIVSELTINLDKTKDKDEQKLQYKKEILNILGL